MINTKQQKYGGIGMSKEIKREIFEWIKVIIIAGVLALIITHFVSTDSERRVNGSHAISK